MHQVCQLAEDGVEHEELHATRQVEHLIGRQGLEVLRDRTLDFLSDLGEPDEDVVFVQDVGNQAGLPRGGELRPPLDVLLLLLRHPGEDGVQVRVVVACLRHPGVHLARRAVELHTEP